MGCKFNNYIANPETMACTEKQKVKYMLMACNAQRKCVLIDPFNCCLDLQSNSWGGRPSMLSKPYSTILISIQ